MKIYLFWPLADTKKIFGLWWGHCEMLLSRIQKQRTKGFLGLSCSASCPICHVTRKPFQQYLQWLQEDFRCKLSHSRALLWDHWGKIRQRSPQSPHLSLESCQAESAAFPTPAEKLAEAAETQAMKGVCCGCVTRTEGSSLAPARQKLGKCPAGQEAAAGSVDDPLLPHSTGSLPLRKEQGRGGDSLGAFRFWGFSPLMV